MARRKSFLSTITLDARPDRLDLRDLPYRPPVASLPPQWPLDEHVQAVFPEYVGQRLILDQGSEGACTGFGLACVLNYLFWREHLRQRDATPFQRVSERMLYHLARFYDEWAGEDYDGSSCRGAMKAWHKHGVCAEALWPYRDRRGRARFVSPHPDWQQDAATRPLGVYYRIDKRAVTDMQAAICQIGAIYCSADVHDGWEVPPVKPAAMSHAGLPAIAPPKDGERSGHAFAIVGYNERGFIVQNSWGETWGASGFAVLPYSDWVDNGSDAWVCALGVSATRGISPTFFVNPSGKGQHAPVGSSLFGLKDELAEDFRYKNAVAKPWPADEAYAHSVVLGNNGRLINRLVAQEDGEASVRQVVCEGPAQWFSDHSGPKRVAIYAHGGLNSEAESITRIRMLAPYFKANGIYPLFLTWKTGPLETLTDLVEDEVRGLPVPPGGISDMLAKLKERAAEALDRTIEAACEAASVKSVWSQMKQNAREASAAAGGMAVVVRELAALKERFRNLELHLIGHSAGSIILGHALELMAGKLKAASCTLYAPACTIEFAHRFARAQTGAVLGKAALHIHLLSDARERDDAVGPYRKSLLYLVSRALEDQHKTPLLGLERAFDPRENHSESGGWHPDTLAAVQKWQTFWEASGNRLYRLDRRSVSNGVRMIPAAHGSFDNDVDVVTATLQRIVGEPLACKVENLSY